MFVTFQVPCHERGDPSWHGVLQITPDTCDVPTSVIVTAASQQGWTPVSVTVAKKSTCGVPTSVIATASHLDMKTPQIVRLRRVAQIGVTPYNAVLCAHSSFKHADSP